MSNFSDLSKGDRIIMELVWKKGETTSNEVLDELKVVKDWTRHTVKTYLTRLIEKGFVGTKPINQRKNMYFPLISKEQFLAEATRSFIDKNYDSLSYMVAGLLKREQITNDELKKLEELINKYKEE
jgi:BlaI family penicillinase repressor